MAEPATRIQKLVLLDNTLLSNFALVHRTQLVTDVWQNCGTTSDAWNEYTAGISQNRLPSCRAYRAH